MQFQRQCLNLDCKQWHDIKRWLRRLILKADSQVNSKLLSDTFSVGFLNFPILIAKSDIHYKVVKQVDLNGCWHIFKRRLSGNTNNSVMHFHELFLTFLKFGY
jgi:hypothetical protein